jgi:hypothetical protein
MVCACFQIWKAVPCWVENIKKKREERLGWLVMMMRVSFRVQSTFPNMEGEAVLNISEKNGGWLVMMLGVLFFQI